MGTNIYMRRIPTAEQKEELKRLLKQQYEETYDEWERKRGHYPPFPCAGYEHVTPAGLRFARDSDFC